MPEDKNCKLLQPVKHSDQKKKKKKKSKKTSTSPPENTGKPQALALPPESSTVCLLAPQSPGQLPKLGTSKKDREQLTGSSRRSKKHPKDSPVPLTSTDKIGDHGALSQGYMTELNTRVRESLRWEGELDDRQAEEKRLELYRANRRKRYIAHREALLKEAQDALRQNFHK
ncbi:protein LIAT1 [Mastacembelus armatus]|uniref:protein LIAT1 n=1 Tax=Mastacembelus armatus TaxID=205130 RepID=UPI000E45D745|nr:protein LIAT1 [Mastacembelus armatus]